MWIDRNSNLTNSSLYTITGPQLMIANISALSDEEDKAIRCCEVLSNGIVVTGDEYMVEPLGMCCVLRSVCCITSVWRYTSLLSHIILLSPLILWVIILSVNE